VIENGRVPRRDRDSGDNWLDHALIFRVVSEIKARREASDEVRRPPGRLGSFRLEKAGRADPGQVWLSWKPEKGVSRVSTVSSGMVGRPKICPRGDRTGVFTRRIKIG